MSDKRAVEGAGPYDADGRFPVGSDPRIAPPTCADVRQAGRRGRRPLRCGRTFPRRGGACPSRRLFLPQRGRMSLATGEGESFPSPVGSDPRIAPPTSARVGPTGCRGRQPLRSDLASPERGGVAGACAGDGGVSPPSPPCHCEPVTDVTGVAIRVPRPRRGRRPRRPASFVLGSKNTDRHTSVATLVRDDRPSACALRGADLRLPQGRGLPLPPPVPPPAGEDVACDR